MSLRKEENLPKFDSMKASVQAILSGTDAEFSDIGIAFRT